MSRRTACCLVPDLCLAAQLRAHPELVGQPLAIASEAGPRAELSAVSPEAARRGVRRLNGLAQARAVCPELHVRVASPPLDRAAREALHDAALGLSPRAALAPPGQGSYGGEAAVYVDASGTRSLFRSEAGFATALSLQAQRLGLPAVVAVAGSQRVAHLAARSLTSRGAGATCVLSPGSEAAFLAPLPLDLFDPDDALAEALTRFGVYTVRQLLALADRLSSHAVDRSRASGSSLGPLVTRLGPGVLELIAAARGELHEPPLAAAAPATLVEAADLEYAVEQLEPLLFALQGPLSRLLARLEARALACGGLALQLELAAGGIDARQLGLASPTLDLRVLMRLLHRALESRPPRAPVLGARIETRGRRIRVDQLDLFRPAGPAPAELGRILAELEALCGSDRVGAPGLADDHRPHAFEMRPFEPGAGARGSARSPAAEPGNAGAPCPLVVRTLRPPVRAEVEIRGGALISLRSPVANGRIVQLAGPWRTTGGWWSPEDRFSYDHFDVQTSDGTVARLRFDHLGRRWEIDAVYD